MGFWSKLGGIAKVAVPIALAATGVGLPAAAAITAGTNIAGSKMQGKGWKGSLIDGMIGAGTGALGSVAAGAGAAKGAAGAAQSGISAGLKKAGAQMGGNFLTNLMNSGTLDAIGQGAGAAAQSAATNRGAELEAMLEADRSEMLMGQQRREEESDLWQKMQATDYIMGGGAGPKQPIQTAFGPSNYSSGPKAISAGNKAMAATLAPQLQKRLANPTEARDYDSKMKAGTGEKILNWVAPIAGIASTMRQGSQGNGGGNFVSEMLQPNIDISGNYRPRISGARVPETTSDNGSWLVDNMQGAGKPTPKFTL